MEDYDSMIRLQVSSGDFEPNSIILWTRVTPTVSERSQSIAVNWFVSSNAFDFTDASLVKSGQVATDGSRDWTVKVQADGLKPLKRYYYMFTVPPESDASATARSQVGRFKTFPNADAQAQPQEVKVALYSCSNFGWGYFNAFGLAALKPLDVDILNHVGDYIYEYDDYPEEYNAVRRGKKPDKECIRLDDYRERHKTHRRDEGLQLLTRSAPTLAMWDDHEVRCRSKHFGVHFFFCCTSHHQL